MEICARNTDLFDIFNSYSAILVKITAQKGRPSGRPAVCQKTFRKGEDETGSRGKLEGAKPASNWIECPAMSCKARLAARAARTFATHRGAKVTAFCQAVKKVHRLF
jgi:hypothetical protein